MRIEPGEIEAAIRALPGIDAAVVMLRADATGTRRLVGYVVASAGAERDSGPLRSALGRSLPPHLVPAALVWLDALPMTPNGKIDRKALPEPRTEQTSGAGERVPATSFERELADLWEGCCSAPYQGWRPTSSTWAATPWHC
ncbi:AMP-binding enzyme [Dankookia sp. P2]|uniref:AMP-binding enzyme n=1 Tax=Dankookia sp. P2 TaxID=3423955 RepID=UPI003D674595